jgi:hypothetical protein
LTPYKSDGVPNLLGANELKHGNGGTWGPVGGLTPQDLLQQGLMAVSEVIIWSDFKTLLPIFLFASS